MGALQWYFIFGKISLRLGTLGQKIQVEEKVGEMFSLIKPKEFSYIGVEDICPKEIFLDRGDFFSLS